MNIVFRDSLCCTQVPTYNIKLNQRKCCSDCRNPKNRLRNDSCIGIARRDTIVENNGQQRPSHGRVALGPS